MNTKLSLNVQYCISLVIFIGTGKDESFHRIPREFVAP